MVKHFDATTRTGEDVHVTLANNTVIVRFPLGGEDVEWAKTEYRVAWLTRPDIDQQFENAAIKAERLAARRESDGTYAGIEVTLTNVVGETVSWTAVYDLDSDWGRIHGPIYERVPTVAGVT